MSVEADTGEEQHEDAGAAREGGEAHSDETRPYNLWVVPRSLDPATLWRSERRACPLRKVKYADISGAKEQ